MPNITTNHAITYTNRTPLSPITITYYHYYYYYYYYSNKTIYLICHFLHAYFTFYRLARYISRCQTLFFFHLKMMTWSHRNVVSNSFRFFSSLDDDDDDDDDEDDDDDDDYYYYYYYYYFYYYYYYYYYYYKRRAYILLRL